MAELFLIKGHPESTVEANQVTPETVSAVTLWCEGVEVVEHDALLSDLTFAAINVPTLGGMQRAQEHDWIVKRPAGDFIVVKAFRFKELFEKVV